MDGIYFFEYFGYGVRSALGVVCVTALVYLFGVVSVEGAVGYCRDIDVTGDLWCYCFVSCKVLCVFKSCPGMIGYRLCRVYLRGTWY